MSAVVRNGKMVQLDGKAAPSAVTHEDDCADPKKLALNINRIHDDIAELKRAWAPDHIDFEDITTTAGGNLHLPHNFGGRVRWWVVDWVPTVSGDAIGAEKVTASTTKDTLVVKTYGAGKATIRVELAG